MKLVSYLTVSLEYCKVKYTVATFKIVILSIFRNFQTFGLSTDREVTVCNVILFEL
jgi:hypothetical protein